jgi:hypothetical protein
MSVRSDPQRRRNLYLALAITLLALTFLFYPGTGGMAWMMWRDAPVLAGTLALVGLGCGVVWWRTPRS